MAGRDDARDDALRQRLDKWLWFARVVKTRTLAAKLVAEGHVRVNAVRAEQAAKQIRPGDVLTIALDRSVLVLEVKAPGVRRGPYEEARTLYEDRSPPPAEREPPPPSPGRKPDRDERRALGKLKRSPGDE